MSVDTLFQLANLTTKAISKVESWFNHVTVVIGLRLQSNHEYEANKAFTQAAQVFLEPFQNKRFFFKIKMIGY
jgi:hypothetical protein